ncbi:TIGR02450 family Trp-rich protein [Thalassotalea ponticola]|uniref:TIGR02450 family Trp-rich protein n=1 Tax=Thalassotalea ponticola TaxID=1523392 RepID=UPI0025B48247|nr:TIGR02450 family Trp-rich protein [Thalassotalea ponticola]MDN3651588.1 TIGR02450 family Trp-rich protein [Thalassotalea ponticola]
MVAAKKLLNSKWTKQQVVNKQRHFVVVEVEYDDDGHVVECVIEAVINRQRYAIDWRQLNDDSVWRAGWH